MTFAKLAALPARPWHVVAAVGTLGGLLFGLAQWAGMPNWGPAAIRAEVNQRVDRAVSAQALRDADQDAALTRMDLRQSSNMDTIRRRLESVQVTQDATLRLICLLTSQRDQRLAQVRCP